MGIAGFGKTQIRYDMFDIVRNAAEAKRLAKCERIYHRAQEMAWDGNEILPMLIAKHGGIHVAPEKKESLKRVFALIMWGELAAWKISAQLADDIVPLEAKMAATSQAFDEARHFYVMHDYLSELGYIPERLPRAPQALLDLVLDTKNPAYKLLGMQLMIETIALTIFQTVRELEVEPVLGELMRYYERDEARHVGLGMQFLPSLMEGMSKRQLGALLTFQARIMVWALWELKMLEKDFRTLGLDPRVVVDRGRRKQLAAVGEAFAALGWRFEDNRNYAGASLMALSELMFPPPHARSLRQRLTSAARMFRGLDETADDHEFDVHRAHVIKTARGEDRSELDDAAE
jgi:hypothetical protein